MLYEACYLFLISIELFWGRQREKETKGRSTYPARIVLRALEVRIWRIPRWRDASTGANIVYVAAPIKRRTVNWNWRFEDKGYVFIKVIHRWANDIELLNEMRMIELNLQLEIWPERGHHSGVTCQTWPYDIASLFPPCHAGTAPWVLPGIVTIWLVLINTMNYGMQLEQEERKKEHHL